MLVTNSMRNILLHKKQQINSVTSINSIQHFSSLKEIFFDVLIQYSTLLTK